jgi:hypothetical protein
MELDMTDTSNAAWLERIGQVKPEAPKPATPTKKEEE